MKQSLWEHSWVDETEFWELFLASHGDNSNEDYNPAKRIYESQTAFILNVNLTNSTAGYKFVNVDRVYVKDHFIDKSLVNVTGIWKPKNVNVSAEDLKNSLPQSWLTFGKKLDDLTVMAEAEATIDSQFPVASRYKQAFIPDPSGKIPDISIFIHDTFGFIPDDYKYHVDTELSKIPKRN